MTAYSKLTPFDLQWDRPAPIGMNKINQLIISRGSHWCLFATKREHNNALGPPPACFEEEPAVLSLTVLLACILSVFVVANGSSISIHGFHAETSSRTSKPDTKERSGLAEIVSVDVKPTGFDNGENENKTRIFESDFSEDGLGCRTRHLVKQ